MENYGDGDHSSGEKCLKEHQVNDAIGKANTDVNEFQFSQNLSLENIRHLQSEFARERNWQQYHTPRNLLLAMVGEVGEVSELFQWKGEVAVGLPGNQTDIYQTDWSEADRTDLAHELSDVLIYLVRLSQQCHIDLPTAVLEKLALNRLKYPAERVYGSSKKYNQYTELNDGPTCAQANSVSTACAQSNEAYTTCSLSKDASTLCAQTNSASTTCVRPDEASTTCSQTNCVFTACAQSNAAPTTCAQPELKQ